MLALRFDGGLRADEMPQPEPEAGEALVRMKLAGICSTDLEIVRGYAGFNGILGHEGLGVVERCDADPSRVGARVVSEINVSCGVCPRCARGHRTHCALRSVMGIRDRDGCFAQWVTVPLGNLHRVPSGVSDEKAIFTEPLAAAFEIVEQVPVEDGMRVAVIGDGKLGLLVAMVLVNAGADTVVVGRHDRKLAVAKEAGARTSRPATLDESDFALVVEATGSPLGLKLAIERVRPRGTVVLKSTFVEHPSVDTSRLVVDEIALLGSRCGPFSRALAALATGGIDPTPLVDARYRLSEGIAAFEHAQRRGTLKVLLDPA